MTSTRIAVATATTKPPAKLLWRNALRLFFIIKVMPSSEITIERRDITPIRWVETRFLIARTY